MTDHELNALAHRMATELAITDIEILSSPVGAPGEIGEYWHDLSAVKAEAKPRIARAERYLEACGRLIRNPENPRHVVIDRQSAHGGLIGNSEPIIVHVHVGETVLTPQQSEKIRQLVG